MASDAPGPASDAGRSGKDGPGAPLPAYPPEAWFAFAVFWALAIVAFLQFFARYVVAASLPWSEEVARHLLVVLAFSAGAVAVRNRSHVAVSVLERVLPSRARRVVTTLADLTQIVFYGSSAWLMVEVARLLKSQRMASLDVSIALLYGLVAASFAAMTLRACVVALRNAVTPGGGGERPEGRSL